MFIYDYGPTLLYLLVYIDDVIVTGNDSDLLRSFIQRTEKEFSIKDWGRLSYFLGLEVTHTSDGLFLGQAKYARDILDRAQMLSSKPVATPSAAGS